MFPSAHVGFPKPRAVSESPLWLRGKRSSAGRQGSVLAAMEAATPLCQSWLTSRGLLLPLAPSHSRCHCTSSITQLRKSLQLIGIYCLSPASFGTTPVQIVHSHSYTIHTVKAQSGMTSPIKYSNFYHNFINFICYWRLLYKSKSQNLFHHLLAREVILSLQSYSCWHYWECSFHSLPTCLKGPWGGVFHGFVCVGVIFFPNTRYNSSFEKNIQSLSTSHRSWIQRWCYFLLGVCLCASLFPSKSPALY